MSQQRMTFSLASMMVWLLPACTTASPLLRDGNGVYQLELRVDGRPASTYRHRGQSYVLGELGARYSLRIHNRSARRVEAVVTVDGLDVLKGKPGNYHNRGYLVPAWGSVDIEGWRLSGRDVAAFRFSSVRDSYAAKQNKARDVGVIGVAIFAERRPPQRVLRSAAQKHESYRRPEAGESPAGENRLSEGKAAPARRRSKSRSTSKRPSTEDRFGLATRFGERRYSPVNEVSFVRANSRRPSALLGLRYNDREGLIALGVLPRRPSEQWLRGTASPFPQEPPYARPPDGWEG